MLCRSQMFGVVLATVGFLIPLTGSAQSERKVTKLADGIYEIQHPSGPGYVNGNTTVVIGQRNVLVVDTCFLPSEAAQDIEQIRRWTDKPVAFVVNTHFHNDHNFGNRLYMDAFPNLTVIAHEETKRQMDLFGPGTEQRFERKMTPYEKMLKTGKSPDGQRLAASDVAELKAAIARRDQVIAELKKEKFQSATLSFDHSLTIDLGGRSVEIMFLGRGNTGGDAVIYLPKENIVMTGDLVVYPIPYTQDGYPSEWAATLDWLADFHAAIIVPGHGPILRDNSYLLLMRDMMKSAVDQLNAKLVQVNEPALGLRFDQVKGGIILEQFRKRFVGNDSSRNAKFDDMAGHLAQVTFNEAKLR